MNYVVVSKIRNRRGVGCESLERGKGRYVQPLSCGGKAEGKYEVGED